MATDFNKYISSDRLAESTWNIKTTKGRLADKDGIEYGVTYPGLENSDTSSNNRNTNVLYNDVTIADKDWVGSRFAAPLSSLPGHDQYNAYISTAYHKFNSTQLGCSLAINPKPQFTRTCDIRTPSAIKVAKGLVSEDDVFYTVDYGVEKKTDLGLGRYYSDSIDDNATTIFLNFGTPKFNSLINYFANAINYEDSYIANHGRVPIGYTIGKYLSSAAMLVAFPLVTITIWVGKALMSIFSGPFNYYYLEPCMHIYWSSVNMLLTDIVTEYGWFPATGLLGDGARSEEKAGQYGVPVDVPAEDIQDYAEMMPGIIDPDTSYINVMAIAVKHQVMANKLSQLRYEQYVNRDGEYTTAGKNFVGFIRDGINDGIYAKSFDSITSKVDQLFRFERFENFLRGVIGGDWVNTEGDENKEPSLQGIFGINAQAEEDTRAELNALANAEAKALAEAESNQTSADIASSITSSSRSQTEASSQIRANEDGTIKYKGIYLETDETQTISETGINFAQALDSALRDGGTYLALEVDYVGSVSESIDNSYGDIGLSGAIKSLSKGTSDFRFSIAGGEILPGMTRVIDAVKGVVAGSLDGVTFGLTNVIWSLLGGGYLDLPKKWEDSSMRFNNVSYTISLRSPYGTPFSMIKNIFIPLSCLLTAALPKAVGKSSYTSPYLCSVFNKGVQIIDLGMITSMSIRRAVDNVGYTKNKVALGVDIDFTITDFSNIVAVPINTSIFNHMFSGYLTSDTPLGRYIGVLASRDLLTQRYIYPKLMRRLARFRMGVSQATNPVGWALKFGGDNNGFIRNVVASLVGEKVLPATQVNSTTKVRVSGTDPQA